jgi:hypothetical protein
MSTIFQRLERQFENLERKAVKVAEKRIRHERIQELLRGKGFFERLLMLIK